MKEKRDKKIQLRLTQSEKELLEEKYKAQGFRSLTEYLIFTGLNTKISNEAIKKVWYFIEKEYKK